MIVAYERNVLLVTVAMLLNPPRLISTTTFEQLLVDFCLPAFDSSHGCSLRIQIVSPLVLAI